MKKNLIAILGIIGLLAFLPRESQAQELRIVNYSPSFPKQIKAQYIANGTNTAYSNTNKNSLEVFDLTDPDSTNSIRRVETTTDSTFKVIFAYKGTISNGIYNAERIQFFNSSGGRIHGSSFPNDILITYQVRDRDQVRTFDLGKECASTPTINDPFEIPLQSPSNAIPGYYATNYLRFTRKESSQPKLENQLAQEQASIEIKAKDILPGENIILESRTNLLEQTDWNSITTNYVPVTTENFGSTSSTTFTNISCSDQQEFFRARVQ